MHCDELELGERVTVQVKAILVVVLVLLLLVVVVVVLLVVLVRLVLVRLVVVRLVVVLLFSAGVALPGTLMMMMINVYLTHAGH